MGNKKKTTLINKTDEVMEIRVSPEIIPGKGKNDVINYAIEAGQQIDIDGTEYDGHDNRGGLLHSVMIFSDDFLRRSPEQDLVLPGEKIFSFKTVTISQLPEDQNSTGVVNYEIKFEQPRNNSVKAGTLKVFSNSVLKHDNGWSVRWNNRSVKLTRKKGMTMTLDPSKLFATVDPVETSLLNVVLKFWPRTFADLNFKDDLGTTICVVIDLMRQAKLGHVRELSEDEADKVVENVGHLHKSCAAMVEWYRHLFPKIQFPKVAKQMAEVDKVKLKRFESTIKDMLRNS